MNSSKVYYMKYVCKKKISIIVPVYNAKSYLYKLIESLKEQSYSNFEGIFVDDGSTDGSGAVLDDYAHSDSRFRVIHQPNMGVSAARNKGLSVASGEFVAFVDSDDYLPVDSLFYRIREIEDSDILISLYSKINSHGQVIMKSPYINVASTEDFIKLLFSMDPAMYQGYLWNKLFRLSIIRNNNIQFDNSIAYNEDRLFILRYLFLSSSIRTSNNCCYYYVEHENTAMNRLKKMNDDNKSVFFSEFISFNKMADLLFEYDKKAYSLCLYYSFFQTRKYLKLINEDGMMLKKMIKKEQKVIFRKMLLSKLDFKSKFKATIQFILST